MSDRIVQCRICGNRNLETVLDLGIQEMTGTFPKAGDPPLTAGSLILKKCHGDDVCGLVQLDRSFDLTEMYGENYGYRSGLNGNMVEHLRSKVERIKKLGILQKGDLVIDIGSNDGTTLGFYDDATLHRVGVDPTAEKFRQYYSPGIEIIPDFFSAGLVEEKLGGRKARVITSFSMFYDLEDPLKFMRQVAAVLEDDGVWIFEQSYLPTMLSHNSYDTVCHEHIEFYALSQIQWMAERAGLEIVDVEFNDVNGGSFSVTAAKQSGGPMREAVARVLQQERDDGIHLLETYSAFAERAKNLKHDLRQFISDARAEGKTVAALGASTKGNVLLQYCELGPDMIDAVGEVNPDKFGRVTPGTQIPIIPEKNLLDMSPDYLLILPWHFRDFFLKSENFLGRNLLFPLPEIQVIRPEA
jgi:NDP-4-keto-2,6-dideoxyhexose 3-C-methyltransferase